MPEKSTSIYLLNHLTYLVFPSLVYRLTNHSNHGNCHLYSNWPFQAYVPPRKRLLIMPQPIRSSLWFPTFPVTSCQFALPGTAAGSREGVVSSSPPEWTRVSSFHMHGSKLDFTDEVTHFHVGPSRSSAQRSNCPLRYVNCSFLVCFFIAFPTAE